ncbi:MAG TPA: TetR/AcrR family transcriptional regulator [Nitrospira sp.]|nr:TetR/AcrR family transcriptional regulator [Nitrospira sp.]
MRTKRSDSGRRPEKDANAEDPVCRRIIEESRKHFFAHGFRGVTMDDLSKELGMSKKTLYGWFASKTALIEAVLLAKFRHVDRDLSEITAGAATDCVGALQRLLACVQGHMGEIQPPFVRDIRRESPELFAIVETRRRDIIQRHFGKVFLEGRKAGLLREDIPPRLAIEILLGAVQAVMNPPMMEALGLTPKNGFSAISRVVLEGLMTDKARTRSACST